MTIPARADVGAEDLRCMVGISKRISGYSIVRKELLSAATSSIFVESPLIPWKCGGDVLRQPWTGLEHSRVHSTWQSRESRPARQKLGRKWTIQHRELQHNRYKDGV